MPGRSHSVSLCLISDPENVVHTRGNYHKRLRSRTSVHNIHTHIRAFVGVDVNVCVHKQAMRYLRKCNKFHMKSVIDFDLLKHYD